MAIKDALKAEIPAFKMEVKIRFVKNAGLATHVPTSGHTWVSTPTAINPAS